MESNTLPLVSVITPAYNRENTIRATLISAMRQEYPNMEYIVVNDGSQDDTENIVRSLQEEDSRIVLINNSKNLWISESRNIWMEHARWEIFAVLDSDDIWFRRDKISKQVAFLQQHPQVGILWTNAVVKNKWKYSYTKERITDNDIRWHTLGGTQFLHSSMVYPREVYETIGGYNPKIKYADDREYQLRAGKCFEFANLPDYMVLYNAHMDNVSHQHRKRQTLESTWLTFRYAWDYPNVLPSIGKKLMSGAYNITTKSLDMFIPWSKDRIKAMIKGNQWLPAELMNFNTNRGIDR